MRAAALPDGVPAPAFRWIMELPEPGEAEPAWVVVASDVVDGLWTSTCDEVTGVWYAQNPTSPRTCSDGSVAFV